MPGDRHVENPIQRTILDHQEMGTGSIPEARLPQQRLKGQTLNDERRSSTVAEIGPVT